MKENGNCALEGEVALVTGGTSGIGRDRRPFCEGRSKWWLRAAANWKEDSHQRSVSRGGRNAFG